MNITSKTSTLLDLVNAANVLVDEANIHLTTDGLSFRSMDPSHIAMIDVLMPPSDFAKYDIEDGVKFALRTPEVSKILKRFDKDEELNLTLDGPTLVISNGVKTYKTRTLDAVGGDTPIPKVKLETHLNIDKVKFDSILGDISVVSEYITLDKKGEEFTASGKGDSGESVVTVGGANGEDARATYSLSYIVKMVKAVSGDSITLEYSNKMPLKLSLGRITYFLAPRVAED